jgi:hypothetical protein
MMTKLLSQRYVKKKFVDGSKVYIPMLYGQEFPDLAKPTAEEAIVEHAYLLKNFQEELIKKEVEEEDDDDLDLEFDD